jgi:hypothetical protein
MLHVARWNMAKMITSGVGRGGRNFPPADVMTVQYLLNCVPAGQGGPSPELVVDGAVGPKTIAAIEKFQRALGGFCDGRVDPGGNTLRALQGRDPYPHQPIAQGGAKGGQGGGYPAGKGVDPFGKTGGGNQGGYPGAKGGDPFGKTGGGNQGGYPPGGKGGGYPPGGKTGGPFGGGGGTIFPGGKDGSGGGGKGF